MKMNLFRKTSFVAAMAATMIFASCSSDDENNVPGANQEKGEFDVAYMSIKVKTPQAQGTRASIEEPASDTENALKSLYVVAFNGSGKIISYGTDPLVTELTPLATGSGVVTHNPDAFRVSSKVATIMLIANPGEKMGMTSGVLKAVKDGVISTYDAFNAAIKDATVAELTDVTNGFTMINANGAHVVSNVEIVGDGYHANEAAAKAAAEANREELRIERLTSKITVNAAITDKGASGTTVDFTEWTLDAINTTFYPYAEKTDLSVAHAAGDYTSNFYTEDPNFEGNEGIKYYNYKTAPFQSILGATKTAYCIENTMAAKQQKYQNATRIVFKATYFPPTFPTATDWFEAAGTAYKTLAAMQAAYTAAAEGSIMRTVCDNFYNVIKEAKPAMTAANFSAMVSTDLDGITDGNELTRVDNCVRWYVKGKCYYYYEIRHDNETDVQMAFGKYGVVRNNWYELTVTKVLKVGTPWYPNVDPELDPKDPTEEPDPKDPIDESLGLLGVTVKVNKWVKWNNEIEF